MNPGVAAGKFAEEGAGRVLGVRDIDDQRLRAGHQGQRDQPYLPHMLDAIASAMVGAEHPETTQQHGQFRSGDSQQVGLLVGERAAAEVVKKLVSDPIAAAQALEEARKFRDSL